MRDGNDQNNIYIQRINEVLNTIVTHLDDDLSLDRLAQVAGFSPFHFHRIFKNMVGETLSNFVWRARLERAAVLLRGDHRLSISEAAFACGFTSLAGFSRAFKKQYRVNPSQWNRIDALQNRNLNQVVGEYPVYAVDKLNTCDAQYTVTFRRMPAQRLAYIRVDNSYSDYERIIRAYHDLLAWYQARGGRLDQIVLYGMSQDDPDITPREQCRFDWCVRVPETWPGDGVVSIRALPACYLAIVPMDGDLEEEARILSYLWKCWIPRSRYQPANLPGMEIYRRLPHQTNWRTYAIDCAIPLTRLA
ncbi:MAG: GyrI-like domain-containing protein [Anaerolineae bacterium]|nr:GyrI-like domain-containing protein [Anaerolineae bacterium]